MIFPDYEPSQEEGFSQFAKTLLVKANGLDRILSWCSFRENASLASWIPDWTTQFSRNHLQWLKKRKAAGTSPSQWSISNECRYLRCRGLIFDSVQSMSASLVESLAYGTEAVKESPVISNTSQSRYGNQKALCTALWKTLRQDHPFRRDPESTFFHIRWINWGAQKDKDEWEQRDALHGMDTITQNVSWEAFDQFRQTNAEFRIFGHKFCEFFPGMRDMRDSGLYSNSMKVDKEPRQGDDHMDQMASDMHLVVLALVGRRLITTTGGYLGLAPEEVLEDDVIAILYGCNFPVVLRQCGDCYYVISECYIDGIMDVCFRGTSSRLSPQMLQEMTDYDISAPFSATRLTLHHPSWNFRLRTRNLLSIHPYFCRTPRMTT